MKTLQKSVFFSICTDEKRFKACCFNLERWKALWKPVFLFLKAWKTLRKCVFLFVKAWKTLQKSVFSICKNEKRLKNVFFQIWKLKNRLKNMFFQFRNLKNAWKTCFFNTPRGIGNILHLRCMTPPQPQGLGGGGFFLNIFSQFCRINLRFSGDKLEGWRQLLKKKWSA